MSRALVDAVRKNDRYTNWTIFRVTVNVIYIYSARDVRVRLGLVAFPFPM